MRRYLVRSLLAVVLFVLCVQNSICNVNIFEFLVGPKLKSYPIQRDRKPRANEAVPKAEEIVRSFGYLFERHDVTSATGHIIELHRIPGKVKGKYSSNCKSHCKPVAFIHHGFLATSDGWLFRGPDKDLPYILADSGYDVWLCNARGNFYSRKHKYLNPDSDAEYWLFSLHEMGYYDLPVVIDYILAQTQQQKLQYIGHSMGSSVLFILCSLRPEYNSKISLHLALGPLANIVHKMTPAHGIMFNLAEQISKTTLNERIYEFMPRRDHFGKLIEMLCDEKMPTSQLCLSSIFLAVGTDPDQFDIKQLPLISSHYPAGTSVFALFHIVQFYVKRGFRAFDYEDAGMNLYKYNRTDPPNYDLSLVTTPTSIYYGNGDSLITKEDVLSVGEMLPNLVGIYKVPHEGFNHLDFFWAKDSKTLLYNDLVRLMNKFR